MSQSRQLAAIMFTDIVGYTALMGTDEQKAFELLNKNRQIQKPIIEQQNGRWIKELGDGVMASFNTVSDAVAAAIRIQETCKIANEFQLRIGIHQGEVVIEENDIFGDAVNIASRLQSLADPGTIFVSESVHDNVSNKKDIHTRFVKEETLKNVKEPVKIFEVIIKSTKSFVNEESKKSPEKSIAVLPFLNISNDPEQDYFCDGISEEIINSLVQLNNVRIIARTSAFAFKNKNIDVREIGKILDVETLLEGSVRKSGSRLRITAKLAKVSDGSLLWLKSYDRELEDIFSIQENIAENVATSLQGVLTNKEKEAIRRPETTLEVYEYYLKGWYLLHQLVLRESAKMFEKAIELDSSYAPAYAGLADANAWLYEWEGADNADLEAAEKYSHAALKLAPNMAESHSSRGYVLSLGKSYDEAEQEFKEAIRLNSNAFQAYYYYGRSCFARGQIRESAELFQKASDIRREDYQSMILLAQSLNVLEPGSGQEATLEGIKRAKSQLELDPNDRRALSLISQSLSDTGEREEGLKMITHALNLYPEDVGVLINGACFFAKTGDKEKALDLLEKVFGKGFGKKDWIEHDPDYDSLRKEPRFKDMLSKLQ